MERGYVKIWRKMQDWEWYRDSQTMGFFLYLIMEANFKDSRYMGYDVPRGSLVCGRKELANQLGLGEQTIRTLLERLKSTNEITIKPTNRFSIISIVNYSKYQDKLTNELTSNLTKDQPTGNQQVTTSKELNKNGKEKNYGSAAQLKNPVKTVLNKKGVPGHFEGCKCKDCR